jgi:mxaL protein
MKVPPRLAAALHRLAAGGQWQVAAAVGLMVVALLLPPVHIPRDTYEYVVTFDITQSMNVEDVTLDGAPASRLGLARAAMRDLLRHLPCGSTIGWSIFADYRTFPLMLPIEVCANYEVLLSSLEKIDGRMRWANASNINKGIYWSLRNVQTLPGAGIIFFTDGQEAPPLQPGQPPMPALDDAAGAPGGWLVGIGGDLPSRIPRTGPDGTMSGYWAADEVVQIPGAGPGQSHEHLSELRERYLKLLAGANRLNYARLVQPDRLTQAILARTSKHRASVATNLRWLPALMALTLLGWHFLPVRPLPAFFPRRTPAAQRS